MVADLSGDERLDLAVADRWRGKVSVLLGSGDGTFAPALYYGAGWAPRSVVMGEPNGDETLDLVVADFSGQVTVLLDQSERLAGDVDGHDLMRLLLAYASCVGDENYDPG